MTRILTVTGVPNVITLNYGVSSGLEVVVAEGAFIIEMVLSQKSVLREYCRATRQWKAATFLS